MIILNLESISIVKPLKKAKVSDYFPAKDNSALTNDKIES